MPDDDVQALRAETARRQASSAAFGEHLADRFADQVLISATRAARG